MSLSDPARHLASLVSSTPPTIETEWLDFKGQPRNDTDLREIWSTALSGFSNTEGGVLVWGIDCRKNADGIDQVDSAPGISRIDTLVTQLNEFLHQATDPPVSGVRLEKISYPDGAPTGFVICFIPESATKPVRAEFAKNKPYYLRIGTSFVIPPRSLLRSLFYPDARARLEVVVTPNKLARVSPSQGQVVYDVMVRNSGPASAHDVCCVIDSDREIQWTNASGWSQGTRPQGIYSVSSTGSLHPGEEQIVTRVRQQVPIYNDNGHPPRPLEPIGLELRFSVFSRDQAARYFSIQYDDRSVVAQLRKNAAEVLPQQV